MSNSSNEDSPAEPEDRTPSARENSFPPFGSAGNSADRDYSPYRSPGDFPEEVHHSHEHVRRIVDSNERSVNGAEELQRRLDQIHAAQFYEYRRRHIRTSVTLFLLTLLSTFLVGSGFFPLEYVIGQIFTKYGRFLTEYYRPLNVDALFIQACRQGLEYSLPLMTILFCHEMGHYLQSVKNRVPASLPYFIPLPLPPMGTMGAVIFQGRGTATRKQMFDIAVWGPLAGLAVTIPVLWYGLLHSHFQPRIGISSLEFGEPLLVQWMIAAIHGPTPDGMVFVLNGIGFAGWVGVLITAINLLPVGQLDGGHIMYTLIGRRAHIVAYLVVAIGVGAMAVQQNFSFGLLLLLLMMTGPRHPPTANDSEPLGLGRHILGWLTLSFLIIGFTPNPITSGEEPQPAPAPVQQSKPDEIVQNTGAGTLLANNNHQTNEEN